MRQIKFRAWVPSARQVLEIGTLKEIAILLQIHEDYLDHEDIVVMQFTGLLDKNGKEIYEGDIISIGRNKGDVFWDETSGAWRQRLNNHFLSVAVNCEVVGNIYENK